jgi:hypothetical protein
VSTVRIICSSYYADWRDEKGKRHSISLFVRSSCRVSSVPGNFDFGFQIWFGRFSTIFSRR